MSDDYIVVLSDAFDKAKKDASAFLSKYNAALPGVCPSCGEDGHLPGLPCVNCDYVHDVCFAILIDTEWGYEAATLKGRKTVAVFSVGNM